MVLGSIFILLVWFILCWRPVVPEVDVVVGQILSSISALGSAFLCVGDTQGNGADIAGEATSCYSMAIGWIAWIVSKAGQANDFYLKKKVGQYAKIYITFMQIMGR